MSNTELNKKIAGWCGFRWETIPDSCMRRKKPVKGWLYPQNIYMRKLPPFTTSLDACFEYIVPKLDFHQLFFQISLGKWQADLGVKDINGKWGNEYIMWGGLGETPALAFCRAVEKLIDE